MRLDVILNVKGREVASIKQDASVRELLAKLAEHNYGALVVSEDGQTVDGMVSERDVVRQLAARGAEVLDLKVSDIMTRVVQCAPPDATCADIMALMTHRRIRHIPVIDSEGRMVGLVSIGDIVKNRLGELEGERDALVQYVLSS